MAGRLSHADDLRVHWLANWWYGFNSLPLEEGEAVVRQHGAVLYKRWPYPGSLTLTHRRLVFAPARVVPARTLSFRLDGLSEVRAAADPGTTRRKSARPILEFEADGETWAFSVASADEWAQAIAGMAGPLSEAPHSGPLY